MFLGCLHTVFERGDHRTLSLSTEQRTLFHYRVCDGIAERLEDITIAHINFLLQFDI